MSAAGSQWALAQHDAKDGPLRLLAVLGHLADEYGVVRGHSRAQLAQRLGRSVDTVDRYLAALEPLVAICRRGFKLGTGAVVPHSSIYKLNLGVAAPALDVALEQETGLTKAAEIVELPSVRGGRKMAGGVAATVAARGGRKSAARVAATVAATLGDSQTTVTATDRPISAAAAACAREAPINIVKLWGARLYEIAGPGLADPMRTPNLHVSEREFLLWANAGADLDLDVVPVIKARTAKPRARPAQSWFVFRDDVLLAIAQRQQILKLPELPNDLFSAARSANGQGGGVVASALRLQDRAREVRARRGEFPVEPGGDLADSGLRRGAGAHGG